MTTFFTVGPSAIYPTYQQHLMDAMNMQLGSISHRSATFRKIYQHTDEQLKLLMQIPTDFNIYFTPSATEIWERILLNLVQTHSFHLVQGAFSSKFFDFAKKVGKMPKAFEVEAGYGFEDVSSINISPETELICTTQNETSSGIQLPVSDLIRLKKLHSEALLCTDIVSSAPYVHIDYNYVDSAFFSVQKAFGMPPGLGVWILNKACLEKAKKVESTGISIGAHHSISSFEKNYKQFETPSTPNVVAIYILGKIAEDMNKIGIGRIRNDIDAKHDMLLEFEKLSSDFSFKTSNINHLSKTVSVFDTMQNPADVIGLLKEKGYTIASGYGSYKSSQIRIANFPSSTLEQMDELIDALKKL